MNAPLDLCGYFHPYFIHTTLFQSPHSWRLGGRTSFTSKTEILNVTTQQYFLRDEEVDKDNLRSEIHQLISLFSQETTFDLVCDGRVLEISAPDGVWMEVRLESSWPLLFVLFQLQL